jgi:hypothetical protein
MRRRSRARRSRTAGREVFLAREAAIACCAIARPTWPSAGNVGPPLAGIGSRLDAGATARRVADITRVYPDSVMPTSTAPSGSRASRRLCRQAVLDCAAGRGPGGVARDAAMKRRRFLSPRPARARCPRAAQRFQPAQDIRPLHRAHHGRGPPQAGGIEVELPQIAENGNSVPMRVRVATP